MVISEIYYDTISVPETEIEWFEVYNPSTVDTYTLQGCVLSDALPSSHTIQLPITVAPQGYITLSNSVFPGFFADYTFSTITLNNGPETIVLTCAATTVDAVVYTNVGPFPAGIAGQSIAVGAGFLTATDNDAGANWCNGTATFTELGGATGVGTPGQANDC